MEEKEVWFEDEETLDGVPEKNTSEAGFANKEDMKKEKKKNKHTLSGSTAVKVLAFILWVLAGVVGAASVVAVILALELGIYTRDFKSVLEEGLSGEAFRIAHQVESYFNGYGEQAALDYLEGTNAQMAVLRKADRFVKDDSGFVWQSYEKTAPTGFYSQLYVDVIWTDNFVAWNPNDMVTKSDVMYRVFFDPNFPKNDTARLYYQGLHALAEYSILLIVIAGICIVLFLVLFVFLLCAAGHKNGEEGIVPGMFTRVPFDFLTVLVLLLMVAYIGVADEFVYSDESFVAAIVGFCLIFGIIGMLYLMDFAIRVKMGHMLRNTLVYKVLHGIGAGVMTVLRNTRGSSLHVIAAFALFCAVEGVVFLITAMEPGAGAVFWMLAKAVEFVIFLYLVSCAKKLFEAGKELASGKENHRVDTTKMIGSLKEHGDNLNNIGKGITTAVEARMKSEHMKTELISNVSHDIKTPLTSIINYADLISHEKTDNAVIAEYAEVLGRQSQRLKKLLEDLVEASKVTTGNLEVNLMPCEVGVLLSQAVGEYQQRMEEKGLELRTAAPEEEVRIMADGRHLWRVFDNLLNNICKYAQENTRVFLTLEQKEEQAIITFRNMSKYLLELSPEELEERFVRGDKSRHKEGSGLGLSIAKNLTELQNGKFDIILDGDLFKVVLTFPLMQ